MIAHGVGVTPIAVYELEAGGFGLGSQWTNPTNPDQPAVTENRSAAGVNEHIEDKAMTEVINGQIIPALGHWQGIAVIIATLGAAYLLRRIRRLNASN